MTSRDKPVVLITGSAGFLGRALVRRLAREYSLVGLDRPGFPRSDAIERLACDLADEASVRQAVEEVRKRFGTHVASVVHLAGYFDLSGTPNPLYERVNVEGSRRLIDALADFGVEQFVFASTMLVHQPRQGPGEPIDEDSPLGATWAYPESKLEAEAALRASRGSIPLVLMRIAGVYDDRAHSPFLAEQIARIYEGGVLSHVYPGMLCAGQSFVHVDDLAEAFARVIARRGELPAEWPVLVGEPEALGYGEIQNIVGRSLRGESWKTVRVPERLAEVGVWLQANVLGEDEFIQPWMVEQANDHYLLDTRRAREVLGWAPTHTLRETLPQMTDALSRDPVGWYETNKLDASRVAWRQPRHEKAHGHEEGGHGQMDHGQSSMRWPHLANIGLGLWLMTSPWVTGAMDPSTITRRLYEVTLERQLPPVEWRAAAAAWSDVISGLAIVIAGALSLSRRTAWFGQWAVAVVGTWLLFAPLVLWSPSAAQFQNDLLVGALAIAFSVLVVMMPGMSMEGMMDRKVIPPGWSYCPSTGAQRLPIAALGLVGLLISRMLAAYQLGHVSSVWEPFFAGSLADPRNGTEEIITSSVSKAWPIPDAGLGTVSYMLEILMAVMGTRARWRTMPWMVTFFGILVIPLGVVSIYFIIIQPIVIGTWSTPALVAALAMVAMIPFALDEVIAMGQYLLWTWRRGKPLLATFFRGGAVEGGEESQDDHLTGVSPFWQDARRGMGLPWTLAASMAIGVFLMCTRLALGSSGEMANSDHVTGALTITVAIIATAEVARALRLANVLFGGWLLVAPWVLHGHSTVATGVSVALGVALIGLSLPRGPRSREHYAGWDRFVV
ncbi:NAD-dependent epimerase/dehydratase family protein [Frateuria soli]|uniref:NAD-dependent epimerase/dehydratase family protein n=1 Tax=Frateuria soli TaxID=1542730 RepID=UPI001E332B26|nr:NAD-dependent epimerase/dehydratase family protein [Frateuria soli]UGB39538.1 NAD-dependent epimerase/dehydratase family protein [Frateuria soli]